MYSFRKDFEDRREEAVKEIAGYKELIAFFERSSNFSQYAQIPSEFIGQYDVELTVTDKVGERLKANWKGTYENGEVISKTEDFSLECEFEELTKIIIYILRKDNIDFKVGKSYIRADESTVFVVKFKV